MSHTENRQACSPAALLHEVSIIRIARLQVARSLYLLGQYAAADQMYGEAAQVAPRDWELWHNRGLCCMAAKDYDRFVAVYSTQLHLSYQAADGEC